MGFRVLERKWVFKRWSSTFRSSYLSRSLSISLPFSFYISLVLLLSVSFSSSHSTSLSLSMCLSSYLSPSISIVYHLEHPINLLSSLQTHVEWVVYILRLFSVSLPVSWSYVYCGIRRYSPLWKFTISCVNTVSAQSINALASDCSVVLEEKEISTGTNEVERGRWHVGRVQWNKRGLTLDIETLFRLRVLLEVIRVLLKVTE